MGSPKRDEMLPQHAFRLRHLLFVPDSPTPASCTPLAHQFPNNRGNVWSWSLWGRWPVVSLGFWKLSVLTFDEEAGNDGTSSCDDALSPSHPLSKTLGGAVRATVPSLHHCPIIVRVAPMNLI
ncbi:hypothetical protein EX30DRAFT_171258 [Ascodesmis nigricans]|uniref:Uncharacterized protein n=1 Tax=Ascodesmis nigricans TaxID=341454 RepID=A0A4S2MM24_9PEZI|nr:hypothetical protein EX30DRAFT_171258 [Ascodesmis nigricans]